MSKKRKNKTIRIMLDDGSILQLKEDEILLSQNMTVTGSCTQTLIREKLGEKRLRYLCNVGFFQKEKTYKKEVDNKVVNRHSYGLGPIGQRFVLNERYCFKIQGHNGYEHSEKMERVVEDLLINKKIDIKNIYNEKEQLVIFKKEIARAKREKIDFRVNDIAYKNAEDKWESIEIVTKSYGKKLKQKHKNYASVINANYTNK